MLRILGYDVYDPREVQPEYTADFAIKRAGQLEKVDYAILSGGQPIIFVECKAHDQVLEDHTGQLAKYFNATPSVKIAVLTNGLRVKVFTDLQQPNILDPSPWIDIDLRQPKSIDLDALRRLRKSDFSVAGEVFPSVRLMPKVVDRLSPILKEAIHAAVLDSVAKSFAAPLPQTETGVPPAPEVTATADDSTNEREKAVVTTPEETQCFEMIAQWIREVHPEATVVPRDSLQYFAVNQGNVRKWFVRFNVQTAPYWIAFRHVSPEDLKSLAPGTEVLGNAGFGDSRAALSCVQDVSKFRTALVTAYNREASRRAVEADSGSSSAVT